MRALGARLGAELMQTHISHVLLAGATAYKIKKPLNLGFLDFTTLAARRHYCSEELRLNRRLAASLYLDVVAITGSAQVPVLADAAAPEAIEYAVKMRRFAQQDLFDSMVASAALTPAHIDALARVIADFHACAAPATDADDYGCAATIETPMRENFQHIRSLLPETDSSLAQLAAVESWSWQRHALQRPVYAQRRAAGKVRECHGDLHLGNIAWVDGAALPFDAIEFNAGLRWIDVISEVAFLYMDLCWHGRGELAQRFLNAYLERSGDYAGMAVFDTYLVYRAMVRAKIAALRLSPSATDAGQAGERAAYTEHLALAQRFAAGRAPLLILMHGVSGSGKSHLARALAESGAMLRLRSDVERKRLAGLSAEARSGSALDAGLYAADMTRRTYAELARQARLILAAGWPLVVDATCLQRWQRDSLRQVARDCAVPCLIIACTAAADILRQRVERRLVGGSDASEADLSVLAQQVAALASNGAGAASGTSDTTPTQGLDADEVALWVDSGREDSATAAPRLLRAVPNTACVPE